MSTDWLTHMSMALPSACLLAQPSSRVITLQQPQHKLSHFVNRNSLKVQKQAADEQALTINHSAKRCVRLSNVFKTVTHKYRHLVNGTDKQTDGRTDGRIAALLDVPLSWGGGIIQDSVDDSVRKVMKFDE